MTAPSEDSPANKYRWIVITLVIGLAVFRWWQQQDAANLPNAPIKVAENEPPKATDNPATEIETPITLDPTSEEAPTVAPRKVDVHAGDDRGVKETVPKGPTSNKSTQSSPPKSTGPPTVNGLKVENVIVKDRDGEVVFRGTIDLTKTLARIDENRTLSEYRNDGVEFKNFERRLPNKSRGHYREWVHPTPGQRGPGAQRVVTGKTGEAFYTWDHYETFVRIRSGK